MKPTLYHYWRSSSSWRVRWALQTKNLACEFVHVDLLKDEQKSAEHLKRNPLGFVPVLQIGQNESPVFLSESTAIIEWLEETHPQPSLLPKDPRRRAFVRQLVQTVNAGIQPLQNLQTQILHSDSPEERKSWACHWIQNGFAAYETLVKNTAGTFSIGDQITMADLYLVPQVYNGLRFDVKLSRYPMIKKIYESALQTPTCREAHPDRFAPPSP